MTDIDLFEEDIEAGAVPDEEVLHLDLDGWEGPLHLLLALSRSQKVDLREISILALVEQYLNYIEGARALKLEIAADYLVMAAWLAYLKSGLLLPKDPAIDPSPEELALRLQLRLQRLNAMRDAGARLMGRDRLGRDVFANGAPFGLRTIRKARWECSLYELMFAYGQVKLRTQPVIHMVARRPVMTLDAAIARLNDLIGMQVDWADLHSFLPPDFVGQLRRSALASTFVATLELARLGKLAIRQDEAFGPLYLKAAG